MKQRRPSGQSFETHETDSRYLSQGNAVGSVPRTWRTYSTDMGGRPLAVCGMAFKMVQAKIGATYIYRTSAAALETEVLLQVQSPAGDAVPTTSSPDVGIGAHNLCGRREKVQRKKCVRVL